MPPKTSDKYQCFNEECELTSLQDAYYTEVVIPMNDMYMPDVVHKLVNNHWKKHGYKPEAILLGWKAALCLHAQCQEDYAKSPEELLGVHFFSNWMVDPWGRSVITTTHPRRMLQYLVDEEIILDE